MKPFSRRLLAAILVLTPPWWTPPSSSAESEASSQGVVVLKSGQILQGDLERKGDKYRVTTASGGKVSVPTEDVDFTARDLGDAYLHQSRRLDPINLDQQIQLARWCWQVGLTQEARRHLSEAITIDPRHARVKHLQTQIATGANSGTNPARTLSTVPTSGEVVPARETLPDAKSGSGNGEVSKEVMQGFTRQIQPLLVARCSGCHAPGSGRPFALRRPAQRGLTPPTVSAANLDAVRGQLAGGNWEEFTEHARIAHGGSQALTAKEYERVLLPWLERLKSGENNGTSPRVARQDGSTVTRSSQAPWNSPVPIPPDPFDPTEFNAASGQSSGDSGTPSTGSVPHPDNQPRDKEGIPTSSKQPVESP